MSRNLMSPPEVREHLYRHVDAIYKQPDFRVPDEEMVAVFTEATDELKGDVQGHHTRRGKIETAMHLDMTVSQLEAMMVGKTVLDIGCGDGVLSQEIARLKKTQVTALDYDPEILSRVPASRSLTPILGSGFDLSAAIGDEKFDVVISSHSSILWARTPEQKRQGVVNAIEATKPGGMALLIPVAQFLKYRAEHRAAAQMGFLPGARVTPEQLEQVKQTMIVQDYHDALVIDTLDEYEDAGRIDCTYVESRSNLLTKPVHPDYDGPHDPRNEHYSVIARVLAA